MKCHICNSEFEDTFVIYCPHCKKYSRFSKQDLSNTGLLCLFKRHKRLKCSNCNETINYKQKQTQPAIVCPDCKEKWDRLPTDCSKYVIMPFLNINPKTTLKEWKIKCVFTNRERHKNRKNHDYYIKHIAYDKKNLAVLYDTDPILRSRKNCQFKIKILTLNPKKILKEKKTISFSCPEEIDYMGFYKNKIILGCPKEFSIVDLVLDKTAAYSRNIHGPWESPCTILKDGSLLFIPHDKPSTLSRIDLNNRQRNQNAVLFLQRRILKNLTAICSTEKYLFFANYQKTYRYDLNTRAFTSLFTPGGLNNRVESIEPLVNNEMIIRNHDDVYHIDANLQAKKLTLPFSSKNVNITTLPGTNILATSFLFAKFANRRNDSGTSYYRNFLRHHPGDTIILEDFSVPSASKKVYFKTNEEQPITCIKGLPGNYLAVGFADGRLSIFRILKK